MDTLGNAILGIVFLALSAAGTFLMFHLWGYPFDHAKLKSSAPPRLMLLHRFIGYAYGVIYVYMMMQMVPRLWSYEIEFPARTVAHLLLGMSIGVILIVKISIVRFFKHLESAVIPFLGILLFLFTFLLIGLSVPFAMKEVYLHRSAVGGSAFSEENLQRVKMLLLKAGLPASAPLEELSSVKNLKKGRDVLLSKCVQCHDMRTILVKPRTPEQWMQTVNRMAERALFTPISEEEQWHVTSYLIAISPELQQGVQKKNEQVARAEAQAAIDPAILAEAITTKQFDIAAAQKVFESTCSQCHALSNVENRPPKNIRQAGGLVARMVANGLTAPQDELEQVAFYLAKTYVKE
ncbi:MAG: hypothetical protein EPO24_00885 [Bacteroidetes bacterium]|nr:MAG: hypothetical protein EPO24_00885 [Bacteroidota bacterium]